MNLKLFCHAAESIAWLFLISAFATACQTSTSRGSKQVEVDYSDTLVLDSLALIYPEPVGDTLVFGIMYGSTPEEYAQRIKALKRKGIDIEDRRNMLWPTLFGDLKVGRGYLIILSHQREDYTGDLKNGKGVYFLKPQYDKSKKLDALGIMIAEKYDDGIGSLNWFEEEALRNFDVVTNLEIEPLIISSGLYSRVGGIWESESLYVIESTGTFYFHSKRFVFTEVSKSVKNTLAESKKANVLLGN